MAAVSAFGGLTARVVPAGTSRVHGAIDLRHRDSLVQMASTHVQHMQKALDQMNLQLNHVISDITGVTGLAIVEAILAGRAQPAYAGCTPRSADQGQRGYHPQVAGGRLSA